MQKDWNSTFLVSCTVFIVFDSLSCGFRGNRNTLRLCSINENENIIVAKQTLSWRSFCEMMVPNVFQVMDLFKKPIKAISYRPRKITYAKVFHRISGFLW